MKPLLLLPLMLLLSCTKDDTAPADKPCAHGIATLSDQGQLCAETIALSDRSADDQGNRQLGVSVTTRSGYTISCSINYSGTLEARAHTPLWPRINAPANIYGTNIRSAFVITQVQDGKLWGTLSVHARSSLTNTAASASYTFTAAPITRLY